MRLIQLIIFSFRFVINCKFKSAMPAIVQAIQQLQAGIID